MSSLTAVQARELGAKRHRVELPWERKGLKEILNPNPFADLKIPAPDWVDLPSVSPTAACSSEPIELVSPCLSSMLGQNWRK